MVEDTQNSENGETKVTVAAKEESSPKLSEAKVSVSIKQEDRDEKQETTRESSSSESREPVVAKSEPVKSDAVSNKPQAKSPARKSKASNSAHVSHPSPQRSYMHDNYPSYPHHGARPPYPPHHAMHAAQRGHPAGGPFAPPPPSYYGGAPHDPYRGPPPHYHQMPPLPHPSQYGPTGHYGPPPNMTGRPGPPPGYPAPYGAPYAPGPPMGYGPPLHQSYSAHQGIPPTSDNNSISSSKSKGSHVSRSTKSSHGGKKRTIEDTAHAYSFRRTNSNASSSSTVTASNNASDMHQLIEESPRKRERSSSRASNMTRPFSYSASNNIFEEERFHRRNPSNASTTSSLSVGGFSLHSYDGPRASPKRRKGSDSAPLEVDMDLDDKSKIPKSKKSPSDSTIDGESSRFQRLSVNDKKREENSGNSLFMSLSTSPINHPEVDATPISKNTAKKNAPKITIKTDVMDEESEDHVIKKADKASPFRKPLHTGSSDTSTPAPGNRGESEPSTDEHILNKHLRGQTFTPLPHLAEQSPSNAVFSSINPTLSWSIAGDTPSLEDLAGCSWDEHEKSESKRPSSTTSQLSAASRDMVISPHNFSIWKEEHETIKKKEDSKDNDTVRLSMLSPNSEIGMAVEGVSGTTTPLPLFFHDNAGSEERENMNTGERKSSRRKSKEGEHDHIHSMFLSNSGRGSTMKSHHPNPHYGWKHDGHGAPPTPVYGSKPPTPLFAGSNMNFARSPLHGDGRDHRMMFGHPPPPHGHNDRVRNLRGRMPPGAHMPPMPLHIPPPMSSHHPLTSPMGIGQHGKPMWSPHHSMPPPMASPHHMSPMNMSQSKRKCVPLKPPIPSKFQGDMDKMKGASVPEFTSLVNFPAHMSQKQSVNLPEGMRCCVMCGQACPCSMGNKKKGTKPKGDVSSRNNGQDGNNMMGDKGSYAIIPTQNKGLCTLCDVNVWVVVNTGLEIKWCKGCKNFRPWAAFGDKGLATKCLRCRERQREKYALQKEEKEKARLIKG